LDDKGILHLFMKQSTGIDVAKQFEFLLWWQFKLLITSEQRTSAHYHLRQPTHWSSCVLNLELCLFVD